MKRTPLLFVFLLGSLALSGCLSTGMARILEPGQTQISPME